MSDPSSAHPSAFTAAARLSALLIAAVATAGSLFFSRELGWLPCELCWYQRILMYPLVAVIAVASLLRSPHLAGYALPFTLSGAAVALYHDLLIKTDWFPPAPCRAGVPCNVDYLNLFNVVTIPFLALTAFLLITLLLLLDRLNPPPPARPLPVGLLLLGVAALYQFAAVLI
jgi:disulfide bond formation protein DsbB